MNLESALKKAAYKVWKELEPIPQNSKFKIYQVREEALTSMAIRELYKANCSEIELAEMIPPKQESLEGYDFELIIGSKVKNRYVRLFVQAKKLKTNKISGTYGKISQSQAASLSEHAKSNNSFAMYAFYNRLDENTITLLDHYNSSTPFDKKSMGITLASAYSVRMMQSDKFSKYHFNNGLRISPKIYTWRHFSHLFYFHKGSSRHLAVPFHELSYFTIEMAEAINKMYKMIKRKSKLNFFFFFFPGMEDFIEGDDDLIPIIKSDVESLISDFRSRSLEQTKSHEIYSPQALIIIDTDQKALIEI